MDGCNRVRSECERGSPGGDCRRDGGRVLVQEHRDVEAPRDFRADLPSQLNALHHRHAFNRDERHDVDRAEARVLAAMRPQIDVGDGARDQREDGVSDALGVARQRENRAVVRRIGRMVEQAHAGDAADGDRHLVDDLGPAALAHIRNALDYGHASIV